MSSEQRSNSAVRNLRSIFENKASETNQDTRGRSPAGTLSPDHTGDSRPKSRVRASFIPVEPAMATAAAAAAEQQNNASATEHKRESSVGLRRASMSEGKSGDALKMLQDTVADEADRRDRHSSVADIIPETAVETPAFEVSKEELAASTAKVDVQPENPDKTTTGVEEEPADMKPAEPTSEQAVSGGEALPPVAEDLRKEVPKENKAAASKANATKPGSVSTKAAPKSSSSSLKSPVSQPKTPLSPNASKAPTKKPSRTSLTAPTAASQARAAAEKAAAPAAKPKPRETTKPADVSSRLTAPTAASRARLESASNTAKAPAPASRPAPKPASSRPTPRPSFGGRPESRTSQTGPKKPTAPVDSSFLERMSRPTAASAAKNHEKTAEVKSPPRKQALPSRPKVNGHAKSAKTAPKAAAGASEPVEAAEESVLIEDESVLPPEEDTDHAQQGSQGDLLAEAKDTIAEPSAEPASALVAARKDLFEGNGNETPVHANGHAEDAPALEDTPAAIGGEDSIR